MGPGGHARRVRFAQGAIVAAAQCDASLNADAALGEGPAEQGGPEFEQQPRERGHESCQQR